MNRQKLIKSKLPAVLLTIALVFIPSVALFMQQSAQADHDSYHFSSVPKSLPAPPLDYVGVAYNTNDPSSANYDPPYVSLQWRNFSNYFLDFSKEHTAWTITRNGAVLASWSGINRLGDGCPYGGCDRYVDTSVQRGISYNYSLTVSLSKEGKSATSPPSSSQTVYVANDDPPEMQMTAVVNGVEYPAYSLGAIPAGSDVTLRWDRVRGGPADRCEASNDWTGAKPVSGSEVVNVGPDIGSRTYAITCYNTKEQLSGGASKFMNVVEQTERSFAETPSSNLSPPSSFGDLNDDGIADGEQENVYTVANSTTNSYAVLDAGANCSVDQRSGVIPYTSLSTQDEGFSYPFGVMNFKLACGQGASTTIRQLFYTDSTVDITGLQLRKYNTQTKTFSNLEGASLSRITANGQSAILAKYSITDGGQHDEDGQANGIIVDPVGIASIEAQRAELEMDCTDESLNADNCQIISYLLLATNTLAALVGIVVVIMVVVGGIQYSASGGDPNAVMAAKKKIYGALLALVAYMFIFSFLQWLVPGGIF